MDIDRIVDSARKTIDIEMRALEELKESVNITFFEIVELITECHGKVILSGMGKSGHIARKISATFASLGTPSFFLHPAEAQHGDMGMVSADDLVMLISNSGETREIINILPSIKAIGANIVAITSNKDSILAKESDKVQIMPNSEEACSLKLAPTSSTTSVLVYGDALAIAASQVYGFTKEDFGLFHPAGALGKRVLIRVKDIMATGDGIPVVKSGCRMTEAIVEMSRKTLGMLLITDNTGKLLGLLTDGDLRRAIENHVDLYDGTVDEAMTVNPDTIDDNLLAVNALEKLKKKHINNYPVVDKDGIVTGAITWQMIIREGLMLF